MVRLPLGSTPVTTAAMVMVTASERFTEPLPSEARVEPVLTRLEVDRPGRAWASSVSSPNRLENPAWALGVGLATVSLASWALAEMVTLMVRMSPTLDARWSWKKVREPLRHNELAEAGRGLSSWVPSASWALGTRAAG